MIPQSLDEIVIAGETGAVIDRILIRMARIGLGWSARDLADRARLSVGTIGRAESDKGPGISEGNLFLIQRAFEEAGIVFIDEDQPLPPRGGRGLRLPRNGGDDE